MSPLPDYKLNSTTCATWVHVGSQNEGQRNSSFTIGFYGTLRITISDTNIFLTITSKKTFVIKRHTWELQPVMWRDTLNQVQSHPSSQFLLNF